MDAKAKVVAWQERYRKDGDGEWLPWRDCSEAYHHYSVNVIGPLPEYETRELIPLTDHEAALAEIEFANTVKQVDDKYIGELEDRLSTLLTGLEALAGELREDMETFKGGVEGSWYRWRYDTFVVMEERIRTLTNSAKGSACVHEWNSVGPGNVPHRALACTKCGKHRDHLNPAKDPT